MTSAYEQSSFVRDRLPAGGLFADQSWHISPTPFVLEPAVAGQLESLGRVLLQFYRAVNLLHRRSVEGKQPAWVANWLDRGKPDFLLQWQRSAAFKNEVPRVIRPDILITDSGLSIVELDSVPGGIGLTAWLNQTYSALHRRDLDSPPSSSHAQLNGQPAPASRIIGGADGMLRGFAGIFGEAPRVQIIISDEAATYRPEMEWLAAQLGPRYAIRDPAYTDFQPGDAVYRFFELFDLANIPNAIGLFERAAAGQVSVTPPPKPVFEEKMLFALLWNRHLQSYWRQELGEAFFERLLKLVPYTWVLDPAPLPPQAVIPELNLTGWHQLKTLSQRERDLILKISGYSELAWGARSVHLGSDLSQADWSAAVDQAIQSFDRSPYVLQRYHKPGIVEADYFDFSRQQTIQMRGRVRLCPYYFVQGKGEAARAQLGGVLATICPADKKIIHGMKDAILAPCAG